jgi:hypothetical protein
MEAGNCCSCFLKINCDSVTYYKPISIPINSSEVLTILYTTVFLILSKNWTSENMVSLYKILLPPIQLPILIVTPFSLLNVRFMPFSLILAA